MLAFVPLSSIHTGYQLGKSVIADFSGFLYRPTELFVVKQYALLVLGQFYVEFDSSVTFTERVKECCESILHDNRGNHVDS